jgi:hypothetical protein
MNEAERRLVNQIRMWVLIETCYDLAVASSGPWMSLQTILHSELPKQRLAESCYSFSSLDCCEFSSAV